MSEPGYCACCRDFHLLTRREISSLPLPVSICRFCTDLGDAEVAWRIAGVTEDGFGYEAPLDPLKRRGGRRRDHGLAESLMLDDPGPAEVTGFGRYSLGQRVLIAWWRMRGRV